MVTDGLDRSSSEWEHKLCLIAAVRRSLTSISKRSETVPLLVDVMRIKHELQTVQDYGVVIGSS